MAWPKGHADRTMNPPVTIEFTEIISDVREEGALIFWGSAQDQTNQLQFNSLTDFDDVGTAMAWRRSSPLKMDTGLVCATH